MTLVIVLLDPLPQISEQERFFKKQSPYEAESPDERTRLFPDIPDEEGLEALVDIFGGSDRDLPRRMNERSWFLDWWKRYIAHQTIGKHVDHEPVFRCIIEQMAPRKKVQVDLDQLFHSQDLTMDFGTSMTQTNSTRDEFCEALKHSTGQISLVFPLLRILCRDTLALLKQLRHTLDEMDAEILNDERMEERLALWRQLISRAQKELPEFATSTRPFVAFMTRIDPDGVYEESLGDDPDEKLSLQTILEDIQSMTERLRVTSASLTSNMALLDSRRSIDEAHAVTRLTELAFIFIPLSFAASVFGMQIEPLASPVPIWWFFVVAVAATGCSYSMRIVMRSHWLTRMKIEMRADIRKYADKHGEPVQTGSFSVSLMVRWGISSIVFNMLKPGKWALRTAWIGSHWIYRQMGIAVSFLLLLSIIIAIPTGILRTHHLSPATQTALSLGMILAVMFSLAAALTLSNDTPDTRTLWPRIFRREQGSGGSTLQRYSWLRRSTISQHPPRRLKKFLLWSIPPITVLVIPMALIWTRSLAIDLKIGATIGIGVLAMCVPFCALAYLIGQRWLQRDLPSQRRTSRIGTTT